MNRVVVFLAMAMGSLRDLEACTHRHICFHSREQFLMEEWPKLDFAFMPHPRAVSISQSPMNCNASADGPLNSRSISPWIYELDRDPNRFPQDLYHARCQCPHCVSLQTGSDMEPRGNSEEVFYNQTVFYRRPCRGRHGGPDSYCLEPRLYPVSLACVCVRPRVSG
ncbi:interleukin-25 [Sorex fumeus]|uniref:interleukin-25 n=1 Tax=Sorex fumeus TaxID=62283 RepID=UPI0024AE04F0|nr:interleukin-25 [Sorex fumeus]